MCFFLYLPNKNDLTRKEKKGASSITHTHAQHGLDGFSPLLNAFRQVVVKRYIVQAARAIQGLCGVTLTHSTVLGTHGRENREGTQSAWPTKSVYKVLRLLLLNQIRPAVLYFTNVLHEYFKFQNFHPPWSHN
jgi:hypothetical protein